MNAGTTLERNPLTILAGNVVDGAAETLQSRRKSVKVKAKWSVAICYGGGGKCRVLERRETLNHGGERGGGRE